jgi:hypothetical protein
MPENNKFKKRGIILGIFLFAILSINLISAVVNLDIPLPTSLGNSYGTFKLGSNISLVQECTNETNFCDFCNLTSLRYPDGKLISGVDIPMTKYLSLFNYTLSGAFTNIEGKYTVTGFCKSGLVYSPWAYNFEVTSLFDELSISQSLIYLILLIINLLFLSLFLILSIKIPYENEKQITRDGPAITKVTKTKYLKLFCIWLSYGLFLWLITIISGMINNYISFDPLKDMISNIYLFSSTLGYGITIFMVWFIFLNIWKDIVLNKKILKEGKALLRELGK